MNEKLLTKPTSINFKFILILTCIYLTIYLISDAVAYKLIAIGPALEPGPPFIFPLSYVVADIITEVYGYKIARQVIWITLISQFFYAVIITLIIHLPSPSFWHYQKSFNDVFGNIVRFIFSGTFAVLSSSFVNIYCVSKWKIILKGKYFWLRSLVSSAIGGFILIFIIIIFGYAFILNTKQALHMFLSIYALELAYSIILAWPAWFCAGYLKYKEKLDTYDFGIDYNPFKFN